MLCPYYNYESPDASGIMLDHVDGLSNVLYLNDDQTVALHRHNAYEMVLILRGTCVHTYRNMNIPLMPGDLFLIPPHQPHAYQFQDDISLYNCQFEASSLSDKMAAVLPEIAYPALQQETSRRRQPRERSRCRMSEPPFRHIGDINGQGIIHFQRTELQEINALFRSMQAEGQEKKYNFEQMKQMYLEYILIQIKRKELQQFEQTDKSITWKEEMIEMVLNKIEADMAEDIDFHAIAAAQNISSSYFRSLFKDHTGLSPVDYLNRVRILRAMELLRTKRYTVSEVSEMVGIYDTNYFSRLFKKIIGYSPRHLKTSETI